MPGLRNMVSKNQALAYILLSAALAEVPAQALALKFVIAWTRASGICSAGVTVTTNSLGTYWNPAGLAMTQTVDIRVDATTGTTVWEARHERSGSYMFFKPNLKDIAKELAFEMISYMSLQPKN